MDHLSHSVASRLRIKCISNSPSCLAREVCATVSSFGLSAPRLPSFQHAFAIFRCCFFLPFYSFLFSCIPLNLTMFAISSLCLGCFSASILFFRGAVFGRQTLYSCTLHTILFSRLACVLQKKRSEERR
eukprot:RCo049710